MAKKPSKISDGSGSLKKPLDLRGSVKQYFEIVDGLQNGLLSHPYDQKQRSLEVAIRKELGLPPVLNRGRGY